MTDQTESKHTVAKAHGGVPPMRGQIGAVEFGLGGHENALPENRQGAGVGWVHVVQAAWSPKARGFARAITALD